jgi:hypothetical protein
MFKKFTLAALVVALAITTLPAQAYYVVHRSVMVHRGYGYGMHGAIIGGVVGGVVAGSMLNSYGQPVIIQQAPVVVQQQPVYIQQPQVIYQQPRQIIQQQPNVIVQPQVQQ